MANMLKDGMAWLAGQMKDSASSTYTYRRSASHVSIDVTIGAVRVTPITTLAGVMADRDLSNPSPKHVDHPFWFNAEDLDFGAGIVEPAEGDTLEVTTDGKTYLYLLCAPLDGGRSFRYADGHEQGPAARICWNGRLKSVT